jgi:uncharacterized short protein YbdD (DUF466 family)
MMKGDERRETGDGRIVTTRIDFPTPSIARERDLKARLTSALKRITGMPDYAGYLAHLHEHHPDVAAPSEREFFDEYLKRRYEGGPTRCC